MATTACSADCKPQDCKRRTTLGPNWTPAPTSEKAALRSNTRTSHPAWLAPKAAAMPAIPPPAIRNCFCMTRFCDQMHCRSHLSSSADRTDMQKPAEAGFCSLSEPRGLGPFLNQKLFAVLALNPFWRLAATSPSFTRGLVAILGCHFAASAAAGACATHRGKHIFLCQRIIGHQSTHFCQGVGHFTATSFFNFQFQRLALCKQFFVRRHGRNILSK